jgi:hypothetical protein
MSTSQLPPQPSTPQRWTAPAATSWPEPVASWGRTGEIPPTPEVALPWLSPGPPPWAGRFVIGHARPSSNLAIGALITGVVGVIAGWCLLGLPCIAAVILGHLAIGDTKDDQKSGRGMAVTGLVLGYVSLIPAVVLFFWMVAGGLMGAGGGVVTPTPTY